MAVTVVGCIAFDTVEVPNEVKQKSLGGSALYCALAASLRTRTRIIGAVGSDCSDSTLSCIERQGVDLDGIQRLEGRTLRWHGKYWGERLQGRETIGVEEGVMHEFDLDGVEIGESDVLVLATAHPKHQQRAASCGGRQLLVLDTIDSYISQFGDEIRALLTEVDILFLNETEVCALAGEATPKAAARSLLEAGPGLVCVKRAHNGATLFGRDYIFSLPAFGDATVADPTGAGDGFAGAFVGYLDTCGGDYKDKQACEEALLFASAVASSIVERAGPEGLLGLTEAEIESRKGAIQKQVSQGWRSTLD